jgi:sarcosine oxidase subunit alpha
LKNLWFTLLKILNGKIQVMTDTTVIGCYESDKGYCFGVVERRGYQSTIYEVHCDAVIIACGAMENMLLFPGNDLPGVYGAGAVQNINECLWGETG